MFHRTDFGGFLVCCYKAIQQLNGVEKNSFAISLILSHNLTGLSIASLETTLAPRKTRAPERGCNLWLMDWNLSHNIYSAVQQQASENDY